MQKRDVFLQKLKGCGTNSDSQQLNCKLALNSNLIILKEPNAIANVINNRMVKMGTNDNRYSFHFMVYQQRSMLYNNNVRLSVRFDN
jgi:hypothetical protein